jgi:hypothetical protein
MIHPDERQFTTGDIDIAKTHCDAVEVMIRLKGHPYDSGETVILTALVSWVTLDSKVKREDHPGEAICKRIKLSR